MDVSQPYIKSTQIFTCPDSLTKYVPVPVGSTVASNDPATGVPYRSENGGYAMNVFYYNDPNADPPTPIPDNTLPGKNAKNLAQIPDPAGTAYVFDFKNNQDSFQCVTATIASQPTIVNTVSPRTLGAGGYLVELHQNRFNTLFCDGHAKSTSLDYLCQKVTSGSTAGAYCRFTIQDDCN